MKSQTKKLQFFLSITVAVLCLMGFSSTWAQGGVIGIEPPVVLHQGIPGQTITFNVKVANPSSKPMRVRANLSDWTNDKYGKTIEYPVGKVASSAAIWAKMSDTTLDLKGNANTTMRYTLTVPKDATPGTHWGAIYFEAELAEQQPGVGAAIATRVSHFFYVNITPYKQSGKINGIFGQTLDDNKGFKIIVQYLNSGNIAQILEGRLEIRDKTGQVVSVGVFRRQVVLPGQPVVLENKVGGPLPKGEYTALVVLNYGDKAKDIAGEYSFTLKAPLEPPN
jgi:hypothetical protein